MTVNAIGMEVALSIPTWQCVKRSQGRQVVELLHLPSPVHDDQAGWQGGLPKMGGLSLSCQAADTSELTK